jgi:hypothetical protein
MIGESLWVLLVLLVLLALLVASLVSILGSQYTIRYRCLKVIDGFLLHWINKWIRVYKRSPLLGHWLAGIYLIPCLIGSCCGHTEAALKQVRPAQPRSPSKGPAWYGPAEDSLHGHPGPNRVSVRCQ